MADASVKGGGSRTGFPYKLYEMIENESDDLIRWSKDGNWLMICKDQGTFLKSSILTKYKMKNNFQNFTRQLNYYKFCAYRRKTEEEGPMEIDPSYLYFHHKSNNFRSGRRDLLKFIKKSKQGTKRHSSMEALDVPHKRLKQDAQKESIKKVHRKLLPKTKNTSKGRKGAVCTSVKTAVSRPDGSDIAKPSNLSLGHCGSGFIISSSIDSQSQASTESQMENTHNIDCSHGERSEHGILNDDSSTDFEESGDADAVYAGVCTKFAEDEVRLYGVHLPGWCMTGVDLPDVYKVIERQFTLEGSGGLDAILAASNLSEDRLHHIKRIANKLVPGKWNKVELRIALGLVALAQKGTEKEELSVEKLATCKTVPIPNFYGDIGQQLTTTTGGSGEESGCFTEGNDEQEPAEEEEEEESSVTIKPDRGPTEGGTPFNLVFKNRPIPVSEFLMVEFGSGNVVQAEHSRISNETWRGNTPCKCLISVEIIRLFCVNGTVIQFCPFNKFGVINK